MKWATEGAMATDFLLVLALEKSARDRSGDLRIECEVNAAPPATAAETMTLPILIAIDPA